MDDRTVREQEGDAGPVEAKWTFDQVAEDYDRYRPGYPREIFDALFDRVALPKSGRILEIGSGTGKATVPLARLGHSILGLEPGNRLEALLDSIRSLIEASGDAIHIAYEAHLYVAQRAAIHSA